MDKVNLIKAVQKASNIIISCNTCDHVKNAENYLEIFKQNFKDDEYYDKLMLKLKERKAELNCEQ
jgi:hypothetical protein